MRKLLPLGLIIIIFSLALSACGGGPKADAKHYAERFPDKIGIFRLEDNRTVELTVESVDNVGHITLEYSNSAGALYIVIDTFSTESSTEVAYSRRMRDLQLLGVQFERNQVVRYKMFKTIQTAEMPNGKLALFTKDTKQSNRTVIIEVEFIKDSPDSELTDEEWDEVLTTIRDVGESFN